MNRFDQDWQKLVALARKAPAGAEDPALPPGFATRLAALAGETPAPPWAGLERLALRGFMTAAACCAAAVAYSYFGQSPDFTEDAALDDTVAEFLALN